MKRVKSSILFSVMTVMSVQMSSESFAQMYPCPAPESIHCRPNTLGFSCASSDHWYQEYTDHNHQHPHSSTNLQFSYPVEAQRDALGEPLCVYAGKPGFPFHSIGFHNYHVTADKCKAVNVNGKVGWACK